MSAPPEYSVEAVRAKSTKEILAQSPLASIHRFNKSGEPYRSMYKNNPWLLPPKPGEKLEWGTGRFWDTTVGRKHPYYKDMHLPEATRDIAQMRHDLHEWGYCLIADAIAPEKYGIMKARLAEQAEAERKAGIAYLMPNFHILWGMVNKGECFRGCIEHNPEWVQAGPVIEQLLDETLGVGWYNLSMAGNVSFGGCQPQALHQDAGETKYFTQEVATLMNTMYILEDVNEVNGGTLIIPGSHKILSQCLREGKEVPELPPTINVEARAGTVMIFDGRLLHGTGANRTAPGNWRYVMTQANIRPFLRQQENLPLIVSPEVLETASSKLLHRLGFGGLTEGVRSKRATRDIRLMMEKGQFKRNDELTPDTVNHEELTVYHMQRQYENRSKL